MKDIRQPAVEGRFYPGTKAEIESLIRHIDNSCRYNLFSKSDISVIGGILPHAGHVYSGYQTVPFFKYLLEHQIIPETIIILHPNHSGFGPAVALDENNYWMNSLGKLQVDKELGALLPYPEDSKSLKNEHSCEVILPFIQYYYGETVPMILPVCMRRQTTEEAKALAISLYNSVKQSGRDVLIIASSDFSHFLSPQEGMLLDQMVLDQIAEKNITEVSKIIEKYDISVCGYGPIMTLMAYANLVSGSYRSEILARGHSGEVSPSTSVVDYISMIFYH